MGRFQDEGNILVSNQSKNVLVNYNFMLRVEGIYDLPCKSVHSFTKENEFEYVQEGGLNDYVHMLRKPVSKPFSFTVERYVGMDIIPPLPLGAELILPVILMVAPNANQFGKAKRTFVFTGCTVMSKTYGELNAERSDLLTETIVIGYREMVEVTVPVHNGNDGKLWQFDGKNVEGNGVRSAATLQETQAEEPRRWLVKEGQNGESVKSAKTLQDVYGKEKTSGETKTETETLPGVKEIPTGEAESRRWPAVSSAKQGKDSTEAESRRWPAVSSAKQGTDKGETENRRWQPIRSAKQGMEGEPVITRKWPPTRSAREIDVATENKV